MFGYHCGVCCHLVAIRCKQLLSLFSSVCITENNPSIYLWRGTSWSGRNSNANVELKTSSHLKSRCQCNCPSNTWLCGRKEYLERTHAVMTRTQQHSRIFLILAPIDCTITPLVLYKCNIVFHGGLLPKNS